MSHPQDIRQRAAGNNATQIPHVVGTQIIDSNGNPLLLRGAMMESSLAYIKRWQSGQDPTQTLNTTTFNTMHTWGMNALRINGSQWIYNLNPSLYLQKLDQIIQQANQAGLYVIFDFHDDCQSGSPYCDGMLHPESLNWWKTIAAHYQNNNMLMFDLINEPNYPNWNSWLHGGTNSSGQTVVGFLDAIAAIRSSGAQQIIVIEPGSAAGSQLKGWVGFDPSWITDPNILYSKHDYENVVTGTPTTWDAEWGTILNHHPIYYGEWAVLPYPNHPSFCKNVTSANAIQVTTTFLQYLTSRNANWTYWDFEPYRLIEDYTSYKPTSFQTGAPWTCQSPSAIHAGAGETIKNFLSTTLKPTNTPTPTTPANTTTLTITAYLDGIGKAGDNSNPNGAGNNNPLHPTRNLNIEIYNSQNQLINTFTGQMNFDATTGSFIAKITTNNLTSGIYNIKISTSQYLRKFESGIQTIKAGQDNPLTPIHLITGDINGDNQLNILDYNMLMDCYSDLTPAQSCNPINHGLADINDDGNVNQFDYNIFLRELSVNNGQ